MPHRSPGQAAPGLSAFGRRAGEGVTTEHVYGLLGTRGGGTGRLTFHGARVPAGNLIGRRTALAAVFYLR